MSVDARPETDAVPPPVRPLASVPVIVLAWLGVLAVLYVAQDVIVPIVFALLLALLFRPALRRLHSWKVPDLVAAFVLVGGAAAIFTVSVFLLAGQAQGWLADAPETIRKVSGMLPKQSGPIGDLTETQEAVGEIGASPESDKPIPVEVKSSETAIAIAGMSGHFIGAAIIVFVLAFFLLGFSDTLLRQATSAAGSFGQKRNIVETLLNVEKGISTYLITISLINVGLGCMTALVLWLLKIPNPMLWGVMVATLNFVPHVGAFFCMVVLFFVGSVSHQSLMYGGLTAGVFVILTSVESYFVTPMVLSKSLQLSPLAVLLAILIIGWMWGIAGGLMAAPLLAVAKIACDQYPSLQALSAFLSGEYRPKAAQPDTASAPTAVGLKPEH
jgi:predicted PurR-regulated permease PerM